MSRIEQEGGFSALTRRISDAATEGSTTVELDCVDLAPSDGFSQQERTVYYRDRINTRRQMEGTFDFRDLSAGYYLAACIT
jgi:cobyric acid synthase